MITPRGLGNRIHGTAGCDEVGWQGKERGDGDWGEVNVGLIGIAHDKPWEASCLDYPMNEWRGMRDQRNGKRRGKEHIRVVYRNQRPGSR